MPRVLHTADWHLGAPKAHPVFLSKLVPSIVHFAKKYECEYVLVVGDVFDKPRPDQKIKDTLSKQLLSANNEITFIFTIGNHDYTNKLLEYHSLKSLSILKDASRNNLKIHVLEPGEIIEFDNVIFKSLKNLEDISSPNSKKDLIIAWHGTPPGIRFSNGKILNDGCSEINKLIKKYNAKYFALGDLHRPIKLSESCYYSGPPVQKTYADLDGIIIVDTEKSTVEKHRLSLPKKVTLNIESESDVISEQEVINLIKTKVSPKNLVKVRCSVSTSTWSSFNQKFVREELREHCLELVLENDPVFIPRTRKFMEKVSKAKTIIDELEIVLEDEDLRLDRDRLKKLCTKYLVD